MKLLELVSIIVPVYNVEQYLKRCIQSILRQTYVHIEIILVDDGSTDHSGKICDAYSKRDHRIRVFHKHNGGQASARNLGIRNSKGDYLAFVDSDDFVHPEYIQYMYNNLKKYKADLSYCGIRKVISQKISKERKEEIIVFDNLNGLKDLFYQRHLTNGPGDKLYKRKLFDDLYFPEGHIFEDFAIAYKDAFVNSILFGWLDTPMNDIPKDIKPLLSFVSIEKAVNIVLKWILTDKTGAFEVVSE